MIIRAADLFCGAGGTSTGLARAVERAGNRGPVDQ
jgi:site-specific DNA-cytosine methylase